MQASMDALYDNNLFRLADGESVLGLIREDFITTPRVSARYENDVARQNLVLSAATFAPRYMNNRGMDYRGFQWSASWRGAVGALWKPGASISQSHSLASFDDVAQGLKDMVDEQNLKSGLQLGDGHKARVAVDVTRRESEHDTRPYLDLVEQGWDMTAGWRTTYGTDWSLVYEDRWVGYQQDTVADRDYRQRKISTLLAWPVTERLMTRFRSGWMNWHFNAADRSSTERFGQAELQWRASDKVHWLVSAQRDADDAGSNVRVSVSNNYQVQMDWQVTDKVATQLGWTQRRTQYGIVEGSVLPAQHDVMDSYRCSLNWAPYTMLTSEFYGVLQNRRSSSSASEYDDQSVGLNLTVKY